MKILGIFTLLVLGISCNHLISSPPRTQFGDRSDTETEIDELESLALLCKIDLTSPENNGEPLFHESVRRLTREGKWVVLERTFSDDRFHFLKNQIVKQLISVSSARDAIAFFRRFPPNQRRNAWHDGNKAMGSLGPTLTPTTQRSSSSLQRAVAGRVRPWGIVQAPPNRLSRVGLRLDRSSLPLGCCR